MGRATVPAVSHLAVACVRGDDPGLRVYAADHLVQAVDDEEVAVPVGKHAVRLVEGRPGCRTAVPGVTLLPVPGYCGDDARLRVHAADAVIEGVRYVQVALPVLAAVERLVQGSLRGL